MTSASAPQNDDLHDYFLSQLGGQGRESATPQPWRPIEDLLRFCHNNDRYARRNMDESAARKVDALTFLPASMVRLIIISFDLGATFRLGCSGPTKFVQRLSHGSVLPLSGLFDCGNRPRILPLLWCSFYVVAKLSGAISLSRQVCVRQWKCQFSMTYMGIILTHN
ncbi:hypothetical protein AVEN_30019-1 [Araneus ventricosus]|uniref:Uncharacterized protein n=1 Tax=Araneus ventricosus TaxID=182803 RepID=A0A4Y2DWP0_ARAVE|nr:hypothetical protein AVEN_30019-1 [Araneus ventricosus]